MYKDWKVYERGGVSFGAIESHAEAVFGISQKGKEYYYARRIFIGLKGSHLYWCYGQAEDKQDGLRWIKRWLRQGMCGNFLRATQVRYHECFNFLVPLLDMPLPEKKIELLNYLEVVDKYLLLHTRTTGISVDAFDDYFEEIVVEAFKRAGHSRLYENKEAWAQLFQPAYISAISEYELALMKLARKVKQIGWQNCLDDIKKIWAKYFWLTIGWGGTGALSTNDVKKGAEKYARMSKQKYNAEYIKLAEYAQSIRKNREKIIQKFNVPVKLVKPYLDLLDIFARLHDERKEIQMRTLYAMDLARRAIARYYKISIADARMLKLAELRELLNTRKIPRGHIQKRKLGYARVYKNGRTILEVEGKTALAFINKEMAIPQSQYAEIKGVIASRGCAVGRAVVTDDPNVAVRLVKKGNILITSMTTPDFVPAMKKAGAIVTNEGGMTAHAAIISREFNIPCLIGTIYATRIFKTGDRVEVDAERGIVRKLKPDES